jgi:hypothetical protein
MYIFFSDLYSMADPSICPLWTGHLEPGMHTIANSAGEGAEAEAQRRTGGEATGCVFFESKAWYSKGTLSDTLW